MSLIEDNNRDGLKESQINRLPNILYGIIKLEFVLDGTAYTLRVDRNE
jgi:hypothetical protein